MLVLPMAGNSSRFHKAGYKVPKYLLNLHGRPVLEWVLLSFEEITDEEDLLFICRSAHGSAGEVRAIADRVGIKNYQIQILDGETEGQAETAYKGLHLCNVSRDEDLTVFNIDTFRPGFQFPKFKDECDGYLEVFEGTGENWSFVRPGDAESVLETTEKLPISNLCSTGLYYFSHIAQFYNAYEQTLSFSAATLQGAERYIAPLYNLLIAGGMDIRYNTIDRSEVVFCGVPAEYEALLKSSPQTWWSKK
jgi:dTDP-glucose pyrophosphorylase